MYCIVNTALQARCINYLFPFLFPNQNFHYMYYMLTFGVQLLFILLMDSDITLLLLMTTLNSVGCIYLNTNLMLFLHSNNSKQWQEKHYHSSIHFLRTDCGEEFTSNAFNSFCANTGIIHHLTCPHTPQQNGIAERKIRHLSMHSCSFVPIWSFFVILVLCPSNSHSSH